MDDNKINRTWITTKQTLKYVNFLLWPVGFAFGKVNQLRLKSLALSHCSKVITMPTEGIRKID